MMGHREKLHGGDEWDAFSRRSRRMLRWKSKEVAKIKARFGRRIRKMRREECRGIVKGMS